MTAPATTPVARGRLKRARDLLGAIVGATLAILPHILHHIGLLAGTALVAGAGGNALFYALGLALSIPMLRRLHRHFQTWLAPAIGVAVFSALFSLSAFVVGPLISGGFGDDEVPAQTPQDAPTHDEEHHE